MNGGSYAKIVNGSMLSIAEHLLTNYNQLIGDPSDVYSIRISSGFRNPEWNEINNGAINSYHQYGLAVDLQPFTYPPNFSMGRIWNLLKAAGDALPNKKWVACEHDAVLLRVCDDPLRLPNHVHIEVNP